MTPEEAIKGFETWHEYQHPKLGKIAITNFGKEYLAKLREQILSKRPTLLLKNLPEKQRQTIIGGDEKGAAIELAAMLATKTPKQRLGLSDEDSLNSKIFQLGQRTGLILKESHYQKENRSQFDKSIPSEEVIECYQKVIRDLGKEFTDTVKPDEQSAIVFKIPKQRTWNKATVLTIPKVLMTIGDKQLIMPKLEGRTDLAQTMRIEELFSQIFPKGLRLGDQLIRPQKRNIDGIDHDEMFILDPEHLYY